MLHKSFLLAFSLLAALSADAQPAKKVATNFPVTGDGKWDYITVSGPALYVSHGTAVHILDKKNGKELGRISDLSGVHGIAVDKKNNKGYISNGKKNNVVVFDLVTYKVLSEIATGNNPDFIMPEPHTGTIITGNGKSNSITVIDVNTATVKATVELGGKPEAIVSDLAGHLYINLEDKNEIAVVNTTTFKIERYIKLSPAGAEPAGLDIDRKHHLLFAGCGNEHLLVIRLTDDKIIATIPIGADCDGVVYQEQTNTVYTSNADGTISVIQSDGKQFYNQPPILTQQGAKTMALDELTNTLYLPVAGFDAEKDASGKTVITPGTFKVLVVR